MEPEKLIGKKVKGFKFETIKDKCHFTNEMNKFIGVVGEIKDYYTYQNSFRVYFKNREYSYPADQIEAHLVEDEIPTLSDGVMMLVGFNNTSWHKRKVIGQKNGVYYAWNGDIILKYKYAKPIEPTKEEQLIAILGSSDKVSEIMELFNDKKE